MSIPRRIHPTGWRRDKADPRDHRFAAPMPPHALPARVDLRESGFMPPVYDQGQLGSCTANAVASVLEFAQRKQGLVAETPSRLFLYREERALEGTDAHDDAGGELRDGIKVAASLGAPPEHLWPYSDANPGPFSETPPLSVYDEAARHKALSYARVEGMLSQMKGALAAGFPFVFGFTVYPALESEEVGRTGVLPMPAAGERELGGHAVTCVGYDDAVHRFLVRNSWSTAWAQEGYFWMPYAYLLDEELASDRWVVRCVDAPPASTR